MIERKKRAAIYMRVSTTDQEALNQEHRLVAVAERMGWEVVGTFEDQLSGSLGRNRRPQFDKALKAAARRQYDVLMVWSIDRIGRSLRDLLNTLEELLAARVDLYIDQQALDTTTPHGRAMYQMVGVFAEFELAMIKARTKLGLERARKFGTKSGKRIGREPIKEAKIRDIEAALHGGMSMYAAARTFRVSERSVKTVATGQHYWQKREVAAAARLAESDAHDD